MSINIINVFIADVEPFIQIYTFEFKAMNIMTQHRLCSTLTWRFMDCYLETGTPSRYAIFFGLYRIVYVFPASKIAFILYS
jgi:hypothetical protein